MAGGGAQQALAVSRASAWNLAPGGHIPHGLHGAASVWVEKNCYVDVWIETLHAQGLDPTAMLAFTVRLDFIGDQWVFFKPPHRDLDDLYGIDVQELNVWKPLLRHGLLHLGQGDPIFTEADAFYLPDTLGTDYRTRHGKTTIVLETIDSDARTLRVLPQRGLPRPSPRRRLRRRAGRPRAGGRAPLPLFAEVARVGRARRLPRGELLRRSQGQLGHHLARRPGDNPFERFAACFPEDVAALSFAADGGLAGYQAYAFATLRQCGANFELAGAYLRWVDGLLAEIKGGHDPRLTRAAAHFDEISTTAKALILRGARAVNGKKTLDFAPMLGAMKTSWAASMGLLDAHLGLHGAAQAMRL